MTRMVTPAIVATVLHRKGRLSVAFEKHVVSSIDSVDATLSRADLSHPDWVWRTAYQYKNRSVRAVFWKAYMEGYWGSDDEDSPRYTSSQFHNAWRHGYLTGEYVRQVEPYTNDHWYW